MKRMRDLFLLTLFCCAVPVLAGEGEAHMFAVRVVKADPAGLIRYEKALKETMELYKTEGLALDNLYVESMDNMQYYFIIPIKKYGDIDTIHAAFADVRKKIGKEKLTAIRDSFKGTALSSELMIVKYLPDVSYEPESEKAENKNWNYFEETIWYINPDKYGEAMKLAADYRKLFEEKHAKSGFSIYLKLMGSDMPLMYIVTNAKDAVHLATMEKELKATLGDAVKPLHERFLSITRKVEVNHGRFRPDLSYSRDKPKEMKTETSKK